MAFAGLAAERGEPVIGEPRCPKMRQCSGIDFSSFLAKRTATSRQAPQ